MDRLRISRRVRMNRFKIDMMWVRRYLASNDILLWVRKGFPMR